MHNHTPSKHRNLIIRFLCYLCSPIPVYKYASEGSDICDECMSDIALPLAYFSPVTNGIFMLGGAITGILAVRLTSLQILLCSLLAMVFCHVIFSFIFAFCAWERFDPKVRSVRSHRQDAQEELKKKARYIVWGIANGIVFARWML